MNTGCYRLIFLTLAVVFTAGCGSEQREAAECVARPGAQPEEPVEAMDPAVGENLPPIAPEDPNPIPSQAGASEDPPYAVVPDGQVIVGPGESGPLPDEAPPVLPPDDISRGTSPLSPTTAPLRIPSLLSPDTPAPGPPPSRSFNPIRDEENPLAARLEPGPTQLEAFPDGMDLPPDEAPPMPLHGAAEWDAQGAPAPILRHEPVAVPEWPSEGGSAPEPDSVLFFRESEVAELPANDPLSPDPAAMAPDLEPPSDGVDAAVATESETESPYTVVEVFYGTDRSAISVPLGGPPPLFGWPMLTACAATGTVVLGFAALRFRRNVVLRWFALGSLACTVVLGSFACFLGQGGPVLATGDTDGDASPVAQTAYSNQRGTLQYGTCEVSIPKLHEVGQLEAPSIFSLDFYETPERHVVLMDVEPSECDAFFQRLANRVETSETKSAFVFVHGFNVTFEDAARRTAQIAYDLKFDDAPIFFSWPSQGGLFKYTIDETNVMWTVPHLREFLTGVAERTGARRIHLVAHSMGNRALTSALRDLSFLPEDRRPRFNEVVLTAPDIDAEVFRKDIAGAGVAVHGL